MSRHRPAGVRPMPSCRIIRWPRRSRRFSATPGPYRHAGQARQCQGQAGRPIPHCAASPHRSTTPSWAAWLACWTTSGAIRAMASYDEKAFSSELPAARLSADDKTAVVQTLASRPSYAGRQTDAIKSGSAPRRDIPAYIVRQMRRVAGPSFVDVWGNIDSPLRTRRRPSQNTARCSPVKRSPRATPSRAAPSTSAPAPPATSSTEPAENGPTSPARTAQTSTTSWRIF